jgi:UDP-N-acetylglucosamine 2-epimerase
MSSTRHRVCLVIGTRPEAIKMAPVYAALREHPRLEPLVVATTQHREMLRQALEVFGIVPDIDLELMQNGQHLGSFVSRAMASLTETFEAICRAFEQLVQRFDDVELVFPVHLNPRVREVVTARLGGIPRIHLLDPISYPDLLEVIRRCTLILSDSGGIQEEAPSFRKPIQVLRDTTERPEVVHAGFGLLVGTDTDRIVDSTSTLLSDPTAYAQRIAGANPFGDGRAAQRVVEVLDQQVQDGSARRVLRRMDFAQVQTVMARSASTHA